MTGILSVTAFTLIFIPAYYTYDELHNMHQLTEISYFEEEYTLSFNINIIDCTFSMNIYIILTKSLLPGTKHLKLTKTGRKWRKKLAIFSNVVEKGKKYDTVFLGF